VCVCLYGHVCVCLCNHACVFVCGHVLQHLVAATYMCVRLFVYERENKCVCVRAPRFAVTNRNLFALVYLCVCVCGREKNGESVYVSLVFCHYGVATISRLPKNIGLFCRRAL